MKRSRSAFTLLEVTIALVILALIGANISMVVRTSSSAYEAGIIGSELENQSSMTLERIRLALMSASMKDLNPDLNDGLHTSHIDYQTNLGTNEDGETVYSDPERIALEEELGRVVNQKLVGGTGRPVVWTKNVPPLYRDEVLNGIDDNGNGLLDEEGLFFEKEGALIRVQLTLRREPAEGDAVVRDNAMHVTCRN